MSRFRQAGETCGSRRFCLIAYFSSMFSEFFCCFIHYLPTGSASGMHREAFPLWWIAETPVGAALILNEQYRAGGGSGGEQQVDTDAVVVGLDRAEELVSFSEASGQGHAQLLQLPGSLGLQAEMKCVAIEVMPSRRRPGHT